MKHKEKAEKQKTTAQKALLASLFKGVVQLKTNEDGEGKIEISIEPFVCECFKFWSLRQFTLIFRPLISFIF